MERDAPSLRRPAEVHHPTAATSSSTAVTVSPSTTTSSRTTRAALPVGVRFRPTDEELVFAYLWKALSVLLPPSQPGNEPPRRRAAPQAATPPPRRENGDAPATGSGISESAASFFTLIQLPEINILRHDPRQLPESACFDGEWYFLYRPAPTKGSKKERSVRTDEGGTIGYWKATGKDLEIRTHAQILQNDAAVLLGSTAVIGMKKKLVFYSKSGSVTPPSPLPVPLPGCTAPDGDDAASTRGKEPVGPLAPVKGVKTEWIMDEYRLEELKRTPAMLEQPKISVLVGGVEMQTSVSEFLESVVVCRVFYRNAGYPTPGGSRLAVHQLLGSAGGGSLGDEQTGQPTPLGFTPGGRMTPAFEQTQACGGPPGIVNPASEGSSRGKRVASEEEIRSPCGSTHATDSATTERSEGESGGAADVECAMTLFADMHMGAQPAAPPEPERGASGWGSGSRGLADEVAAAGDTVAVGGREVEQEPAGVLLGAAPGATPEQCMCLVTSPQLHRENAELSEEAVAQQDLWLTGDESSWMQQLLLDTVELVDHGEAWGMLIQGCGARTESVVVGMPLVAGTAAAAESSDRAGSAIAADARKGNEGMEGARRVNQPDFEAMWGGDEARRRVRRRYAGGDDEGNMMGAGIENLKVGQGNAVESTHSSE